MSDDNKIGLARAQGIYNNRGRYAREPEKTG